MRIIELVGLPGCGKSTIIDYASKRSREKFVQRNELLYNTGSHNDKQGIWRRFRDKTLLGIHYFLYGKEQDKKYYSRLINLLNSLYCANISDAVLVLEEGFIQYLSSLSYDHDLYISKTLKCLIKRFFNDFDIIVVSCTVPVYESASRIRKRKKRGDRYYIEDEEQQIKLLTKKQENINTLLAFFPGKTYTMDMTRNPEDNAKLLTEIMEENT